MNRLKDQGKQKDLSMEKSKGRVINRPQKIKDTSSGENSELYYIEPDESIAGPNYNIAETKGRTTIQSRSPTAGGVPKSIISTVSSNIGDRSTVRMSQQMQSIEVPLPRRDNKERSPMNINIGETRKEREYNIQTLNAKRGFNQKEMLYQTFTNKPGDVIQMNTSGYIVDQREQPSTFQPSDSKMIQTSTMIHGGTVHHQRNPSDSIQGRDEDDSRFSNLKFQMEKNTSGENDGSRLRMKGEMNQLEEVIKSQVGQKRDTLTNSEVKKMVTKLTKAYDPNKGNEGALISTTQTIIPSVTNPEMFKDRYQVLQKMNRLSTILLSKNKNIDPVQEYEQERKTFDRQTLTKGKLAEGNKGNLKITKTGKQKFLFISMAMISSKGPNCEDRIILRKFRFDKGGVVDLAQETNKSKTKYQVKKITRKKAPVGTNVQRANPKYREKAAKIVQAWWRELRDRYKRVYDKIILIQSVWRGRWIRKYMYDIIYLSFIYQSFCASIQKILVHHVRPYVFDMFTADKKNAKDTLLKLISQDMKYRCIKIKPFWEHWKSVIKKYNNRNLKSKKLIDMRRIREENLLALHKAFQKYRLITNLLKFMKKSSDEEGQKRKFFGLIKMIQGGEKLSKRTGLQTIKPHLIKYIVDQIRQKAVRVILHHFPRLQKFLFRNMMNKWREQIRKLQMKEFRNQVFWGKVGSCKTHFGKNILRKYMIRWHRFLPKNTDINFFNGSFVLQKAVWRNTFKDPLKTLIEKEEFANTKDAWLRMLGVKSRYIRQNWRDYFYKWRNQVQKLKDQELKNKVYQTLLANIFLTRKKRIFSNKFNHWRKVPKIDMEQVFAHFRNMITFTEVVVRKGLIPQKTIFFKGLQKTTHPRIYHTATQRLLERYMTQDRIWMRYILNKWKDSCHKLDKYDLKLQLLRFSVMNNNVKNNKNTLSRAWNKWKAVASDLRKNDLHQEDDQLKEKMLKKRFGTKLMLNMKNHFIKENKQNQLRVAFILYRNKVSLINERDNSATNEALKHMKKHNILTNAPYLLNELQFRSLKTKRTNVLRSMPKKYCKGEKLLFLKYFMIWKKKNNLLIEKENIDLIRRKLLKRYCLKTDKETLTKHLNKWKIAGLGKRSNYPLIVGTEKLKQILLEPHWQYLKKKINMMNLSIPEGMSLQSALLRGKRNLGKSICIKNITLRPYVNRWRKKASLLKNRDLKHELFNKMIYPNIKKQSKLPLRRALNHWRDQTEFISKLEVQKHLYMKIMSKLYSNGSKIGLTKVFNKWKNDYQEYIQQLKDANNACYKMRKAVSVKPMSQFRKAIMYETKYNETKARLLNAFRGNDKNNLAFCFNKWKKAIEKLKEFELKTLILKQVMKHQDIKGEDYKKNRLHAALLNWRIRSSPNLLYKKYANLVKGTNILSKTMMKPFNQEIMDKLSNKADNLHRKHVLFQFFSLIDPQFEKKVLKSSLSNWKNKLSDTLNQKEKITKLFNRHVLSHSIHKPLIQDEVSALVNAMKSYEQLRNNKALSIQDFCRGILNIKRQLGLLKRLTLLHNQIKRLSVSDLKQFPLLFNRWRRNIRLVIAQEDARTIQNFLKSKVPMRANKQKQAEIGAESIKKYLLQIVLNRLNYSSKQNVMRQLQRKVLKNKMNADKKSLREKFHCWENLIPHLRQDDASTKIQNSFKNYKAYKKVNLYRLRNGKIKYLIFQLFEKYFDIRKIYFAKWLNETEKRKCNDNAKTIQVFLTKYLQNYKINLAKTKLQDMFIHLYLKKLKNMMFAAASINSNRGAILFNALENIFIRQPFGKLMNAMKWIARVKIMKSVLPKIKRALRLYYTPHYLRLWKRNTVDERNRKVIQIQSWFRMKMVVLKAKIQLRKNALLTKYFLKMTHDKLLLKSLPFKLWARKSHLILLDNQALNIQKIWKGNTSRKNVDRILNKNKLRELLRKGVIYQISTTVQNSQSKYVNRIMKTIQRVIDNGFDKRYATNNLIDYANDVLRNKYLFMLTGKKSFIDSFSYLRYAFNRWKNKCNSLNNAAIKIQLHSRAHLANNKRKILRKLKDLLLMFVIKYTMNDFDKLRGAFQKWNLRANYLKCQENSKIIQQFIKPKLVKLFHERFVNYFLVHATKITKHRLNSTAKEKKFKETIIKVAMSPFFTRLRNKIRADQLKWFLIKKFQHLDDDLKKMLLEKYFYNMRTNAKKKTDLMLKGVILIQANFRQLLAKNFLAKLKARRARILQILIKLTNDAALKLKISFNLWRTNTTALKLNEASKIIQAFLHEMEKRRLMNKDGLRLKRISDSFEILCLLKFPLRIGFNQIRSQSNRVIFSSFINLLHKKRLNHLKTGYDAIRQRELDNLLNGIFKIPSKCRQRILKRLFRQWRDNANALGKLRSTQMIQKNYRLHSINKRWNDILKKMRPIMFHLHFKYGNVLKNYFNKWNGIVQKGILIDAGKTINDFIRDKWASLRARNNWNEFTDGLNIVAHNYASLNLMRRLKILVALQKLFSSIDNQLKRNGYNNLMEQLHLIALMKKFRLIFDNYDRRNEILLLLTHFKRWVNTTRKLVQRDIALNNIVKVLDNRYKCIATDSINAACLIKKLFDTIPKIRALEFFHRLRGFRDYNDKLKTLRNLLCKGRDDFKNVNKKIAVEKINKEYIYIMIRKMYDKCAQVIQRHKKPSYDELIRRMFILLSLATADKYKLEKKTMNESAKVPLAFKSRVTNPKNRVTEKTKSDVYFRLTPYLVTYLNKKYDVNKGWALDKLKGQSIDNKFCYLFKFHTNKALKAQKKHLYDSMKERSDYLDSRGPLQAKLFMLLRKTMIRKITTCLVTPSHMYRLLYLIKMSLMHKEIKGKRFGREIIRKWRFMSFVKKMAKRKLEMMYQNLHMNYIQTTNLVFGENDNLNLSLVKEFENLGENMGMFVNESVEQSNSDKITAKTISRQEMFDPELMIKTKHSEMYSEQEKMQENEQTIYKEFNEQNKDN